MAKWLRNFATKKAVKLVKELLLSFVKVLFTRLAWLTAEYIFNYVLQLLGLC